MAARKVLRYEGVGVEQGNSIPAEDAVEYALSECGLEVRFRRPMRSHCWVCTHSRNRATNKF